MRSNDRSEPPDPTGLRDVPDQGSLEALPLPRLLVALHRGRYSGSILLQRSPVEKRVTFDAGYPVAAESNVVSESLGVQLMDAGRISRDEYVALVQKVQARGCKEGTALLQLRLLAPRELFDALKRQLRLRLLDCFGWPQGQFLLDAAETPDAEVQPFRCDPLRIVYEGLATRWSIDRCLAELATALERTPVAGSRCERMLERVAASPAARRAVAALDGSRRLAAVLAAAGDPEVLAALWLLDATGAFEYRERPLPALPDAELARAELVPPEIEVVVAKPEACDGAEHAPREVGERPAGREAEQLRREILERHAGLAELDHYALLGVAADADAERIKRAYFQLAKRYHPDALARPGLEDLRGPAQELFAAIARANATLGNPTRRREYDAALSGGGAAGDAQRLAQAETLYRKGEILLRAGRFGDALGYLGPAVDLWPEEATYRAALGWALYKQRASDPAVAREQLERAAALDPRDPVIQFRLGLVRRALEKRADGA